MSKNKKQLDKIMRMTFKHAKKLARDFYFNEWVKNPPKCAAFDGEIIHISRIGWEHIMYDEAKTCMDVLGRLFVLERAKELLEYATQFQDYEKRGRREYWAFEAVIDEVKIRVIVEAVDKTEKHFLSVIRKGSVRKEIKKRQVIAVIR
ncbi:MAG: hypothetical protein V1891_00780 [bacterium]